MASSDHLRRGPRRPAHLRSPTPPPARAAHLDAPCWWRPALRSEACIGGALWCHDLPPQRCPVSRVLVLLVLVAAFAPAAVLGALPLVLLAVVSVASLMAAVVLARPEQRPVPVPVDPDQPAV